MEHEIKSAIIAAIWAVTNEVHDINTAADIATARIIREAGLTRKQHFRLVDWRELGRSTRGSKY